MGTIMSVAGYLRPGAGLPRMSRTAGKELGAEFHGAVLRGELTAAEKLGLEAMTSGRTEAERYFDVSEYDPVLRAHCRL
jgi:hypothetical protein